MKRENSVFSKVMMIVLLVFFYAPIVFAVVISFNSGKSVTRLDGFSFRWYKDIFNDHTTMEALIYTIVVAVLATLISTVVGTLTAIGLSNSKKIFKVIVEQVNDLPMMNPDIVTAIGILMLFSSVHMEKGFATMLLAHVMFCIPYVIVSIMPRLRQLDSNLAEAAMDLGATPIQALIKVIIPQLIPGIVSGALIAFTMSFDDFVISYFVSGNGVSNISIFVYTMKRSKPSINALATLVIAIISVFLLLANFLPGRIAGKKKKA